MDIFYQDIIDISSKQIVELEDKLQSAQKQLESVTAQLAATQVTVQQSASIQQNDAEAHYTCTSPSEVSPPSNSHQDDMEPLKGEIERLKINFEERIADHLTNIEQLKQERAVKMEASVKHAQTIAAKYEQRLEDLKVQHSIDKAQYLKKITDDYETLVDKLKDQHSSDKSQNTKKLIDMYETHVAELKAQHSLETKRLQEEVSRVVMIVVDLQREVLEKNQKIEIGAYDYERDITELCEQIEALKTQHSLETESLKKQIKDIQDQHVLEKAQAIAATTDNHAQCLVELKAQHATATTASEQSHTRNIEELRIQHSLVTAALEQTYAKDIGELKVKHSLTLAEREQEHAKDIEKLKAEHSLKLEETERERRNLVQHYNGRLDAAHTAVIELTNLKLKLGGEIDALKAQYSLAISTLEQKHIKNIGDLHERHSAEMDASQDAINTLMNAKLNLIEENEKLKDTITELNDVHETTLDTIAQIGAANKELALKRESSAAVFKRQIVDLQGKLIDEAERCAIAWSCIASLEAKLKALKSLDSSIQYNHVSISPTVRCAELDKAWKAISQKFLASTARCLTLSRQISEQKASEQANFVDQISKLQEENEELSARLTEAHTKLQERDAIKTEGTKTSYGKSETEQLQKKLQRKTKKLEKQSLVVSQLLTTIQQQTAIICHYMEREKERTKLD